MDSPREHARTHMHASDTHKKKGLHRVGGGGGCVDVSCDFYLVKAEILQNKGKAQTFSFYFQQ